MQINANNLYKGSLMKHPWDGRVRSDKQDGDKG
jgi:hypothetical protein